MESQLARFEKLGQSGSVSFLPRKNGRVKRLESGTEAVEKNCRFSQSNSMEFDMERDLSTKDTTKNVIPPKTSEYPIKVPMSNKLKCAECHHAMSRLKGFERHSLRHSPDVCKCQRCKGSPSLHKIFSWKEGRLYNCRECGEEFEQLEKLDEHVETHNRTDLHFCALCRAAHRDLRALEMHMREQHPLHKLPVLKYRALLGVRGSTTEAAQKKIQAPAKNPHSGCKK